MSVKFVFAVAVVLAVSPMEILGQMVGGFTNPQLPTEYVKALFENVKCEIEKELGKHGLTCEPTLTVFQSQVVAGINYRLYMDLQCSKLDWVALVFVPLPEAADPFPQLTMVYPYLPLEPGPVIPPHHGGN